MIEKLYKLKKAQISRKLIEKIQLTNKINEIKNEIEITQGKINSSSVEVFGAISDFTILQMHKNSMKLHISKLQVKKNKLDKKDEVLTNEIGVLQKQSEQFSYILKEEKKKKIKLALQIQDEYSNEYIQNKYIKKHKG